MKRKPQTFYFTMVHVSPDDVRRVGRPYLARKTAQSWVKFVKGAWIGLPVSVRKMVVKFDADGRVTAACRERLSKEFNCEVE